MGETHPTMRSEVYSKPDSWPSGFSVLAVAGYFAIFGYKLFSYDQLTGAHLASLAASVLVYWTIIGVIFCCFLLKSGIELKLSVSSAGLQIARLSSPFSREVQGTSSLNSLLFSRVDTYSWNEIKSISIHIDQKNSRADFRFRFRERTSCVGYCYYDESEMTHLSKSFKSFALCDVTSHLGLMQRLFTNPWFVGGPVIIIAGCLSSALSTEQLITVLSVVFGIDGVASILGRPFIFSVLWGGRIDKGLRIGYAVLGIWELGFTFNFLLTL